MTVLSLTEPTTAFVGAPRDITTVSEDSVSASSLIVIVTIPIVPSEMVTVSSVVKSSAVAVPVIVNGIITG